MGERECLATSRRRRQQREASQPVEGNQPETAAPPPSESESYGRELLRRSVIVLMTALLVARPLVLGEDPAMSSSHSDAGMFVLSLLMLCVAAGYTAWRFWSKRSTFYAGPVEVGLLLIVVGAFVSTAVASNKHAAWLTSWEWLVLLVGFCTLRQLAVSRAEIQGFTTTLLATAVSLIFFAIYQGAIELPALTMGLKSGSLVLSGSELEQAALRERIEDGHVFGPYAHPNSFAGYLVLFLPGLFGVAWLARHVQRPLIQRMLVLAFAVVGVGALYLTHSRGAMLGLLVASVVVAGLMARHWLAANPAYLFGCILGVVGVVVGGYLVTKAAGKTGETAAVRLEYWSATTRLLAEQPILGVGPGNFATSYTKVMAPNSVEKIKDPHNLFLELWATHGLIGFVGILLVAFAFVLTQRRLLGETDKLLEPPPPEPAPLAGAVRWEFYVGGALGLLLGFALRAIGLSDRDAIYQEGVAACVRTILWFLAFALFEPVQWPTRYRSTILTVGVLALLGNLFVSGGIGFPSVAGMMLAAMALALNSPLPKPLAVTDRYHTLSTTIPFPVAFALVMVYMAGVFYPTVAATTLQAEALQRGRRYLDDQVQLPRERRIRTTNEPRLQANNPMFLLVRDQIVKPLVSAQEIDRWDPSIACHIAQWFGQCWLLNPSDKQIGIKAIQWALEAQRIDPRGREGYATEAELREMFGRRLEMHQGPGFLLGNAYGLFLRERTVLDGSPGKLREEIRTEYRQAAKALERFQPNDPTDAGLAYQIADLYSKADDQTNMQRQAENALALDKVARGRLRKLSDPQRTRLETWLGLIKPS